MPGSLTGGVPDYHDPYQDAQRLLSSPRRRDREKGEHMLRLLESQQNRQLREDQFNQTNQAREDARSESAAQRGIQQEQLNTYREGLLAEKERSNQAQQVETLRFLLTDPTTPEPIKQAIQQRMLAGAGVQATIPPDPKMVALAKSRGLPEPQGTTIGGPASTGSAPGTSPAATATANVAPEERFVPLGANPLEGSRIVNDGGSVGIRTPSGGFAGGVTEKQIAAHPDWVRPGSPVMAANAGGQEGFRGKGAGSSWSPNDLASNVAAGQKYGEGVSTGQLPSETTPAAGFAGSKVPISPELANLNQKAGEVGQSMEPLTMAKNALGAVGSLFSGGQGGASQIVGGATPAPGTEFQGPVTGALEFANAPLAPTPNPAGTPPAVPRPEEERKRLMAAQY